MTHKQSAQAPLPFTEWVEQTYPQKSAGIKFLRAIGALDLAYLMYVMKTEKAQKKQKPEKKPVTPHIIPVMPLKVEDVVLEQPKTVQKPKVAPKPVKEKVHATPVKTAKPKTKKVKKTPDEAELTIEFEHKPEPLPEPKKIEKASEPIEPEPLILDDEPMIEEVKKPGKNVWIDDESLEDIDLRKSGQTLTTGDVTASFDVVDIDDEQETQLIVNGTAWRAMLPSPALNLSRMAQIVRASYGELYVLGRMALGAMSGECTIAADEAARIVTELAACTTSTCEIDITCFDRNKTSKNRKSSIVRIRFDRC